MKTQRLTTWVPCSLRKETDMTHTKDEALKLALGKIKAAKDCHFAAIDTLLFEAEELLEQALAAQTAVPDAMTSADIQEHIEYVAGWNDCRQAILEMMK
jgi:hypothetical protein